MGRHVVRTVGELGDDLCLAPERFDPRRTVAITTSQSARRLADVVDVVTDNVTAAAFAPTARVLVLDTTHAWDGFVLARHAAVAPAELGSAKRMLAPGDVIISRLRPYLRQVAYVDEGLFIDVDAVVASTEFYVLRGKGTLDAACLVPYLLSTPVQTALAAGQEGGHHPRFDRAQLEALPLPAFLPRRARAIAAEMRTLARTLRATLVDARALIADIERRLA